MYHLLIRRSDHQPVGRAPCVRAHRSREPRRSKRGQCIWRRPPSRSFSRRPICAYSRKLCALAAVPVAVALGCAAPRAQVRRNHVRRARLTARRSPAPRDEFGSPSTTTGASRDPKAPDDVTTFRVATTKVHPPNTSMRVPSSSRSSKACPRFTSRTSRSSTLACFSAKSSTTKMASSASVVSVDENRHVASTTKARRKPSKTFRSSRAAKRAVTVRLPSSALRRTRRTPSTSRLSRRAESCSSPCRILQVHQHPARIEPLVPRRATAPRETHLREAGTRQHHRAQRKYAWRRRRRRASVVSKRRVAFKKSRPASRSCREARRLAPRSRLVQPVGRVGAARRRGRAGRRRGVLLRCRARLRSAAELAHGDRVRDLPPTCAGSVTSTKAALKRRTHAAARPRAPSSAGPAARRSEARARVCGASDAHPLAGCAKFANWTAARETCEAPGARLCSLDELSSDEARGTGCGFDDEHVWSATPCGEDAYFVQRGASTGGDDAKCVASGALHAVRCCADDEDDSARGVSTHRRPTWSSLSEFKLYYQDGSEIAISGACLIPAATTRVTCD